MATLLHVSPLLRILADAAAVAQGIRQGTISPTIRARQSLRQDPDKQQCKYAQASIRQLRRFVPREFGIDAAQRVYYDIILV